MGRQTDLYGQGKERVENRRGVKDMYSHPKSKAAHTNHREGKSIPVSHSFDCKKLDN